MLLHPATVSFIATGVRRLIDVAEVWPSFTAIVSSVRQYKRPCLKYNDLVHCSELVKYNDLVQCTERVKYNNLVQCTELVICCRTPECLQEALSQRQMLPMSQPPGKVTWFGGWVNILDRTTSLSPLRSVVEGLLQMLAERLPSHARKQTGHCSNNPSTTLSRNGMKTPHLLPQEQTHFCRQRFFKLPKSQSPEDLVKLRVHGGAKRLKMRSSVAGLPRKH